MSEPSWEPNFFDLWPTLLLRRRLAEHKKHYDAMVELVEGMDREHQQLTAHFQTVDIFALDHAGIRWLRKGIDDTITAYLKESGVDYRVTWSLRGWANINRFADYHAPHNHAWSYLSGTYYLKMPAEDESTPHASRPSPASISFYDPRAIANMLAVADENLGMRELAMRPEQGTLMMWDSAINHSVHPNLSQDTRITISFNAALTWSDQMLGSG